MKRVLFVCLMLAVAALPVAADPGNGNAYGHSKVDQSAKNDRSPNLRDMNPIPPQGGPAREKFEPKRVNKGDGLPPGANDAAIQTQVTQQAPAALGSFEGVGLANYAVNAAPPDTNGAIGRQYTDGTGTHQWYVQWVNEAFAVFDAQTGNMVYGPANGNTLWQGFGGTCQSNNDGDPIVQFDKIHDRWIFTQFAVSSTPYTQCVAVSTSQDPTGSYNRYSFSYGTNFNDYPKLGVWPDAYYITYNMFNGNSFAGGWVCAWDSAQMLAGQAATQQCFNTGTTHGGELVSDVDGNTLPPAGEPNYLLEFGTNSLNVWKFHVDWANTANTTLTGPTSLPVSAFSMGCAGGACIKQPGTSQLLDSLADRLMYRLAYRNFGSSASMVVNHTVKTGTNKKTESTAVRWYELRVNGGNVSVFQQSTFAPDTTFRWMGSTAMDKTGNIVLGYSTSSGSAYPSIKYTMRTASDPINTMQPEASIFAGTGAQLRSLNRWGDYSSLSVDPTDDCTMYFTTEYLAQSGTFNWHTRVGKLKVTNCN
ncbi:MAG TPA: hypothetical protein VII75_11415 [Thermoanaerobaculia bacterium]